MNYFHKLIYEAECTEKTHWTQVFEMKKGDLRTETPFFHTSEHFHEMPNPQLIA